MIDRSVATIIDQEKCIGCGLCVKVCPNQTISMQDGKAVVSGDRSLQCGHCVAVCPVDAVRVTPLDQQSLLFSSFELANKWLPHGEFDTSRLVQLMASRRSCRNYTAQKVVRSILEDLVKIGTTAPSGTNCQDWTFTILPDRAAVVEFAERIGSFFKRLNRMAEKRWLRQALRLIGKPTLEFYYRQYYLSVKEGLAAWEELPARPSFPRCTRRGGCRFQTRRQLSDGRCHAGHPKHFAGCPQHGVGHLPDRLCGGGHRTMIRPLNNF